MRKGANYRSEEDSPFAHCVLLAGGKEGKKGAWGGQQGVKEKKYVVQAHKKKRRLCAPGRRCCGCCCCCFRTHTHFTHTTPANRVGRRGGGRHQTKTKDRIGSRHFGPEEHEGAKLQH